MITIERQMLINAFFPRETTPPRKFYSSEKKDAVKWKIELPDVVQLRQSEKVKLAAVLHEAPCFQLSQQAISDLLNNEIDRANISRWKWRHDKPEEKYRETWRNTLITLVAIYFQNSRATASRNDVLSHMQSTATLFDVRVRAEDIFKWRGDRNLSSSKQPTLYASAFVEILKEKGLFTDAEAEKALKVLSDSFDVTVKYFSRLALDTQEISAILRSSAHPYFLEGLNVYFKYIHPLTDDTAVSKKSRGSEPKSKQIAQPLAGMQRPRTMPTSRKTS